ncbi:MULTISPECIES: transposase [unclassified Neochlamydia]|uniref:transposase n=1 Tax=unclassified Neochlamydia TaxID=2643326 RepID=UPI00325B8251
MGYGYKGKGMTTHLLVDGNGSPLSFEVTSAKGDERKQVEKLIDPHQGKLQRLYEFHPIIPILRADKGYDSEELRDNTF